MAKEFQFMDEETALQERPLGNYADALGKSYKDLEDRLRKEQSGGGFWSDLGKNFLNEAVVKPLATQATEAVSGLINDPFDENRKEFYEETEQKEAKRKYDSGYLSQAAHNKDEAARLSANKTEYEWELSSPRVLQDFRTAFKTRAAEEGWDASPFTAEQIDGLTYEYRRSRAEKAVKVRTEMTKASTRLKTKEDMIAYHETFNKRGKGIVGAVMNFIGRPVRGDFVDKAAKDFLESAALEDIIEFQKVKEQYAQTNNFEDMMTDVYGINIEANNYGIAKKITTKIQVLNGDLVKIKTVETVNKRTNETNTQDFQIGTSLTPNKTALKSVPTVLSTIKGYKFSPEAERNIIAKLNKRFKDAAGENLNLQTPYQQGNKAYNLPTYNKMIQEVLDHGNDLSNFVDAAKERAKELNSQTAALLRNSTYLESLVSATIAKPTDPKLVAAWEKNQALGKRKVATYLTAVEKSSRIHVGLQANLISVQTVDGQRESVPRFHKMVQSRDKNGVLLTTEKNGDIVPVMKFAPITTQLKNGKFVNVASQQEILEALQDHKLFELGRMNATSTGKQPVTAKDMDKKLSTTAVPPVNTNVATTGGSGSQKTVSTASVPSGKNKPFVPSDEDVTRIALADQATKRNKKDIVTLFGKNVPYTNPNLAKQTQSSLLAQAQIDDDIKNKLKRTVGK